MLKIEREMLSDEQLEILKGMLHEYQKEKCPSDFARKRIQEIKDILRDKEEPIISRAYQAYTD